MSDVEAFWQEMLLQGSVYLEDSGPGWSKQMRISEAALRGDPAPVVRFDPPVLDAHYDSVEDVIRQSWRQAYSVYWHGPYVMVVDRIKAAVAEHADLLDRPYRADRLTPVEIP